MHSTPNMPNSAPVNPHDFIPDDRSQVYRSVGDILTHVAERSGVTVDPTTHTRWREAMGLMREFDTFADEQCATPQQALSALGSFSLFATRYPALTQEALGQPVRNQMMGHVRTILELGQLIAVETDVTRFLELRKVEAYHTVQILGAAATGYVKRQPNFSLCMWHLTGFGIGANLADSVIDARYDYACGKARLQPSASFYSLAAAGIMRHSGPHMHTALDQKGVAIRIHMIAERVANRLKHGITPYSNLRLVAGLWRRHPRGSGPT